MQRAPLLASSVFVAALLLAACGGGSSGGGTPATVTPPGTTAPGTTAPGTTAPSTPTPTPATTPTPTPQATNPPSMPTTATISGSTVLIGQNGHTLYVFSADTANTSNCGSSGGCNAVWPAYSAPAGTTAPAGSGFGIITRSDGTLQWTNGTQPLYEYAGDSASGTVNGQGITSFGGTWTAAQPAGTSTQPTSTPYNPYIRTRP